MDIKTTANKIGKYAVPVLESVAINVVVSLTVYYAVNSIHSLIEKAKS